MEDVVIFVAGNPDLYPLEYYDAGAESYEGVIPELLARFSEQSRYQVRYLQPGVSDRRSHLAENRQVQDLLAMTPHYWRITKDGAARLAELTRLDERVSAIMNVYRREAGCGFTFPGFSGTMQANTGR